MKASNCFWRTSVRRDRRRSTVYVAHVCMNIVSELDSAESLNLNKSRTSTRLCNIQELFKSLKSRSTVCFLKIVFWLRETTIQTMPLTFAQPAISESDAVYITLTVSNFSCIHVQLLADRWGQALSPRTEVFRPESSKLDQIPCFTASHLM